MKGNFVFWFGAQFNSTLNFTQSGWLILFNPDLHFQPENWVSCQTHSLSLENTVQYRRHTSRSSNTLFSWTTPPSADVALGALLAAAAAAWTHEGTYLIYGFLARDTFNKPRTGTTLCHPKNWLCQRDACIPQTTRSSQFTSGPP